MNGSAHRGGGYDGAAEVVVGPDPTAQGVPVRVTLRGLFQPIDGRYHWYGRIRQNDKLDAAAKPGASVVLRTPDGAATGSLSDRDPWGRYRIGGTGPPPFLPAPGEDQSLSQA